MKQLENLIKSQVNLDEDILRTILLGFTEKKVAKDQSVLRRGQIATNYFFIQSGALRISFDNKGKETTVWIALENEFFTDLSSLINQVPSRFNIVANETTTLLLIRKEKMEEFYKKFPAWERFGRRIWENAFLRILHGVVSFQTMTAEERYLKAMKHTELLDKIPLKQLASYLGITPTSLSRLRKNLK